nr:hypothetical protein [Tanacetum cinerariifolium]
DLTTKKVTGLGSMKEGLYHIINVTHDNIDYVVSKLVQDSMQKFSLSALGNIMFDNKVPRDSYDFQDFVTTLLAQKDPVNFKEAVLDPEWCAAMDLELKALDDNSTWELTTLPVGKKAIGSHWLFKTKLKAGGTEERNKTRFSYTHNLSLCYDFQYSTKKKVVIQDPVDDVVEQLAEKTESLAGCLRGSDTFSFCFKVRKQIYSSSCRLCQSEVHMEYQLPLPRYGLDAPPAQEGLSDGYDRTLEYVRYSSCLLGLPRWGSDEKGSR